MNNLQEVISLYSSMEPSARDIVLKFAQKCAREWPAKKAPVLRLIRPPSIDLRFGDLNNESNNAAPLIGGIAEDPQ